MPGSSNLDQRFGLLAVEKQFVTREKLDRALVVQRCIFTRTQVQMPIAKVLKEMGLMDEAQIDAILEAQTEEEQAADAGSGTGPGNGFDGLVLTVDKDQLSASVAPGGNNAGRSTLQALKALLAARGVVHGIVGDAALEFYLSQEPMSGEPFTVARGSPVEPGRPAEIQYHFDIDPLRIGTLKSDGTIDWRDRGHIPQVKIGDLLAEKINGDPGRPGTTVLGTPIAVPRVREPQLKCGRGAQRSEDGRQVVAKLGGTPRLGPDGKISVFSLLPIAGDVGLETGHIDFDGYIEVAGGISAGFNVKGRGLRTKEIQNSRIDISEDLVSFGGVYSSSLKVGGDLKASHIHNCVVEVVGDIVIEKEIFGCTIETNGQCIVSDGKIIGSKIDAKKGIVVKDVGTEAAKPSELIVGIDRRYEREMKHCKEALQLSEQQEKDIGLAAGALRDLLGNVAAELGTIAREQEQYAAQKRQFEGKLVGPGAVEDEEECCLLRDLIAELDQKIGEIDVQVAALMEREDVLRAQLRDTDKIHHTTLERIKELRDRMNVLDEMLLADPGIPVVKVSGTIQAKTLVAGPYKKLTVSESMHSVRIAEAKMDFGVNRSQMKISDLR